ncbi:alpha/beta hydrolase [Devosia neptuniae]|jgi:acetyl esterase|uniref:alpha/beta hydrolase n=1 Tax=Devosia TaxID=46913 RepID=UPI0022AF9F72|nr:alpha/beta hydrolase [Devosia neptuniae]MCZ4347445.1 alpha/beta hydrolase [Devosia neptuniae]|tara:strand:- start:38241 stop:39296 length:1056 start_codon:yes stop_codon:yes gene_type:complete
MTDPRPDPDAAADSIGRIAELIGQDPAIGLDTDMKLVIDMLGQLGARPLEQLSPDAARSQPRATDAIAALMAQGGGTLSDDQVVVEALSIPGGDGSLAARLYRPAGLAERLNPMVLYFHGGGFVTGDLDSHDASARAFAWRAGAIVLSLDYRLAPEHGFPAAHDDAWAAWGWLSGQAHRLGGDPRRIAVAGEDAGANLAMHVALKARETRGLRPVQQVLIHPIADTDMSTPSYDEALRTRPIGLPAMRWRFKQLFPDGMPETVPALQLVGRDDLAGLPPSLIVLAGIDPLRSEGEALASALSAAGVAVTMLRYDGVTQGFFGMGRIVTKALFAQADVADGLSKTFAAALRR